VPPSRCPGRGAAEGLWVPWTTLSPSRLQQRGCRFQNSSESRRYVLSKACKVSAAYWDPSSVCMGQPSGRAAGQGSLRIAVVGSGGSAPRGAGVPPGHAGCVPGPAEPGSRCAGCCTSPWLWWFLSTSFNACGRRHWKRRLGVPAPPAKLSPEPGVQLV